MGFTQAKMKHEVCTYPAALAAAVDCWREQEALESQYRDEKRLDYGNEPA